MGYNRKRVKMDNEIIFIVLNYRKIGGFQRSPYGI